MADPANVFAVDDIRSMSGSRGQAGRRTKADLIAAIDRYPPRGRRPRRPDARHSTRRDDDEQDSASVKEVVDDAPIVRFVNLLITQAIQDRASDIHIEPGERELAGPVSHRRRAARGHALAQIDPGRRHSAA